MDDLGSFSSLIHDTDTEDGDSSPDLALDLNQVKVEAQSEVNKAFIGVTYIAEHLKVEDNATNVSFCDVILI